MSNVMDLKSLQNHVKRNGFDKSQKNTFSAKAGELLPVFCEEVLPGDKFKINLSSFTRTMPVDSAAYVRLREYYDFYFVPYHQLWRYADNFFSQMPNTTSAFAVNAPNRSGSTFPEHPYFTSETLNDFMNELYEDSQDPPTNLLPYLKDVVGMDRYYGINKILNYLGYVGSYGDRNPDKNNSRPNVTLSPFPALAYQKIYSDYYRFDQWELPDPSTFNVDYMNDSRDMETTFDGAGYTEWRNSWFELRYCNWHKDLFTGLLPRAQFGDTALATGMNVNDVSGIIYPTLSVFALRQAEFLQKWKEITISGKQNYKEQLKKHWNVDTSDIKSGLCTYLGGTSSNIDINEVVNTNLADSDSKADILGKGSCANNGSIDFTSDDYGIIMGIYHVVPLLDYTTNGFLPMCLKKDATDYAIPEMDSIGMQSVPLELLYWPDNDDMNAAYEEVRELGYAPRYYDYKTSVDKVRGIFESSLKNWVSPVTGELTKSILNSLFKKNSQWLDYSFFKVRSSVLDSIFALNVDDTVDTDQFLVNSFFDCKVVRNLDYNGLPY